MGDRWVHYIHNHAVGWHSLSPRMHRTTCIHHIHICILPCRVLFWGQTSCCGNLSKRTHIVHIIMKPLIMKRCEYCTRAMVGRGVDFCSKECEWSAVWSWSNNNHVSHPPPDQVRVRSPCTFRLRYSPILHNIQEPAASRQQHPSIARRLIDIVKRALCQ